MKGFLILLAGLMLSPMVSAQTCVSAEEMTAIATDFRQFRELSGKEFCLEDTDLSGLIEAIVFMRATAFSEEMPVSEDDLFSGRFANDWYGYFKERIKDIVVPSNCPPGVGAYVYFGQSSMYVCPMLLKKSFSALDRASVFMHEARHLDGFPHETCRRGARKGMRGACDGHISDGGSYGVSVETYAQLANYAGDLHPALRAYARASAVTYADEAFNRPTSIDRTPQLLLATSDGQVHLTNDLNDLSNLTTLGEVGEGRLVPYASSLMLQPTEGDILQWFPNNEGSLEQAPPRNISVINQLPADQRADLKDFHIAGAWKAVALSDRLLVSCGRRSNGFKEMKLPKGELVKDFVYLTAYSRVNTSVKVRSESGKLFELNCRNNRGTLREAGQAPGLHLKRVFQVGERVFANTIEGTVVSVEDGGETPQLTPIDGEIVDLVPWEEFAFFDE